ncbi:MAG: amidohydrolase family protein [Bryobacteraceae bacterium]
MAAPLMVRGARQLLTLRESRGSRGGTPEERLGIIADGSLLIEGGRIAEVGVWRRIGNLEKARGIAQADVSGCLVMPGLVDGLADLFAGAVSVPVLRKRVRAMLENGTTTACYRQAGNTRQLRQVQELGLEVHATSGDGDEPMLPLCDPHSRWREGATLGSGFDGHKQLAVSMPAAIALASRSAPVEEAILAATLYGARRLGIGQQVGALVPGYQADFVVLDIPQYTEIPYHLGENRVRAVYKRGVKVYERGEPYWHGES